MGKNETPKKVVPTLEVARAKGETGLVCKIKVKRVSINELLPLLKAQLEAAMEQHDVKEIKGVLSLY